MNVRRHGLLEQVSIIVNEDCKRERTIALLDFERCLDGTWDSFMYHQLENRMRI